MAVPKKLVIVPNAATRELWDVVENGEVHELEAVLARADINGRNEHGMTALMRAAYHGRVQMVRALLENGADPNVMRNDKFTALSLAAFFGHGEIVDILIEHGAKTDVATRFGTSPYLWAKARSFTDVARSLEKRSVDRRSEGTVASVVERPKPLPPRVAPPSAPIIVRTLKDPPEIWDLVQEAPRQFDPRAAFVARLGSRRSVLTMAVMLVVVSATAAAGAMFYTRHRVANHITSPTAAAPTFPAPVVQTPATTEALPETPVAVTPLPETPPVATEPLKPDVHPNTITRRSRSFPQPSTVLTEVNPEPPTVETAVEPTPVAPPKIEARGAVSVDAKKPIAPPSSQIISGQKAAQPKAKVIQWP